MNERNSECQVWLSLEYHIYVIISRTALGMLENQSHLLTKKMYVRLIPQGLAVPVLTALVYANKVKKKEKSRVPFSILFKPSTQTSTSPSLVERVSLSLSLRKVRSTLSFSLSHLQFFLYLCCYFSIWFNVNYFLQAVCNLINCLFSYIFIKTLWTLPK